jgi:hypothetical protein
MDDLIEPRGAPRPRLENVVVEAFRKDAARASNRVTAEAPGMEHQHDAQSCDRQVRQATRIPAVNPIRNRSARRARAVRARRAYRNDGAVTVAQRINRRKPRREQP